MGSVLFTLRNNMENNESLNTTHGRIIAEHKERYVVRIGQQELDAEISGHFRHHAMHREDFPAVGDFVELNPETAIIQKVMPRKTMLARRAVGKQGELQVIAANIDVALLMTAVDEDFSINRLERYLALCKSAEIDPLIVLTKSDLIDEAQLQQIKGDIAGRIPAVQIAAISSAANVGIESLMQIFHPGKTYCMLGSSGVGKSTLLNLLVGKSYMRTTEISTSTGKGRHATTHRELIELENGAYLIDNPGMREVGITRTLRDFEGSCKFSDCTHTSEKGCAVLLAVQQGELDPESYENYLKMLREQEHYESSVHERRKKDRQFGKMLKAYNKQRDH
jgi:ribosome biogenesis GTPase